MKTQSRTIILAMSAAIVALTSLGVGALALQLPDKPSPWPAARNADSCPPNACTIVFKTRDGTPSNMRTAQNTGLSSFD